MYHIIWLLLWFMFYIRWTTRKYRYIKRIHYNDQRNKITASYVYIWINIIMHWYKYKNCCNRDDIWHIKNGNYPSEFEKHINTITKTIRRHKRMFWKTKREMHAFWMTTYCNMNNNQTTIWDIGEYYKLYWNIHIKPHTSTAIV